MLFIDRPKFRTRILILVALVALICALPRLALARNWLDFPLTNFNIYNADGGTLMGRGFYEVRHPRPGQALIYGENRYLDGEYDIESDLLQLHSPGDSLPTMLSFNHTFYNPDGTHRLAGTADTKTGEAACNSHDQDGDHERTDTLDFPTDTLSGAALIVPIERALNLGLAGPIELHVFYCAPAPRIIALKVGISASDERWRMYPGNLILAEAVPDLGALNFFAAPFLPKVHAWFDPRENFLYIGGEIHRYLYGDDRIILVKDPNPGAPGVRPTNVKTSATEASQTDSSQAR
jgi:hypothetical protein